MSTNRSYLEQIDDEIAFHQSELEKLAIARQVIARLAANKPEKAQASQAAAPAAITIRRAAPQPAPQKEVQTEKAVEKKSTLPAGRTPERKAHKALIREQVVEHLQSEPLSSTMLINRLLPPDAEKSDKQTIYDALYLLKQAGTLTRSDDALYHLVKTPVSQQATTSH